MVAITFTPVEVDLAGIRAGDLNALNVTLTMDDTPFDLTDCVVTSQARQTKSSESALDAVIEVTDEPGGEFVLRWPGEEVRTLLAGAETWRGVWDLQVQTPTDPDPVTMIAGKFTAELDVTREGA